MYYMSHIHVHCGLLNTSPKRYMHVYIHLYLKYRKKRQKKDYFRRVDIMGELRINSCRLQRLSYHEHLDRMMYSPWSSFGIRVRNLHSGKVSDSSKIKSVKLRNLVNI